MPRPLLMTIENLLDTGIQALDRGDQSTALRIVETASMLATADHRPPAVLGAMYMRQSRYGLAIPLLYRAIEIGRNKNQEYPQVWMNLGICYRNIGFHDMARQCYDHTLKLQPGWTDALINYTGLYINEGKPEKIIEWCDKAESEGVDDPRVTAHRALALLEMGRYSEGWALYDARFQIDRFHKRAYTCPMWNGRHVGTLAIHPEQGIGDEILFSAWIRQAQSMAGRVVIECAPRLKSLFARSFGCAVYGTDEEMQAAEKPDAWVAMGSLPRILGAAPQPHEGYLKPDPERVAYYRGRLLALGSGPYIGLTWEGGTLETHAHLRAPGLSEIERITRCTGTFVSLQYGEAGGSSQRLGIPHWQEAIDDLDEFAALVAALDRVITVCQTAVHFGGALNVPTWVMTPAKAAWRYGLQGSSVPWYPSVRLFRQPSHGEWTPVVDAIIEAMNADH